MRIMAVDPGDARTGLAVSDLTGSIAGEAWVISSRNFEKAVEDIASEAEKRQVGTVVLGYPKNMDGSLGPRAEKSERMAALLREKGLEVVLWDERRTTVDAHRILSDNCRHGEKRKDTVDAVAATLILEGYLGSLK